MISHIFLPESIRRQYQCEDEDPILPGLNRVNIFIGPNNSGKSRFLRNIFSETFELRLAERGFSVYLDLATELYNALDLYLTSMGFVDLSGRNIAAVKQSLARIKETLAKGRLPGELEAIKELDILIKELADFHCAAVSSVAGISAPFQIEKISGKVKEIASPYTNKIIKPAANEKLPDFEKIYIPILRGLRPLNLGVRKAGPSSNHEDHYRNRTLWDYFSADNEHDMSKTAYARLNIVTGLNLYGDVRKMLLGSIEQRERIRKFEVFLSNSFFGGQPVALTPHIESDCLYVTIGKTERPIFELGDGIQNLIILLYPIFFHDEKSLLCFIEEPEISLHPGLQRLFVDTIIGEQFRNIQFFITTHSNHLLDMTLDHSQLSIYNFESTQDEGTPVFSITNTQNEDIKLLDAIGVRNSSLFLSNCTIWVEGITDRLYLNKYMDLLQQEAYPDTYESKRLKEDIHFSYIEYGGANLTHYAFGDEDQWDKIKALRISSKILLIMDADDTLTDADSSRHASIAELKALLGDRLIVLPCREIENTLSVGVLRSVITEKEGGKKIEFGSLSEEDYKTCYLDDFIHDKLNVKKRYRAEQGSGTIRNKVAFCKSAIKAMDSAGDLSASGRSLAETVLTFIRSQNP